MLGQSGVVIDRALAKFGQKDLRITVDAPGEEIVESGEPVRPPANGRSFRGRLRQAGLPKGTSSALGVGQVNNFVANFVVNFVASFVVNFVDKARDKAHDKVQGRFVFII